MRTIHIRVPRRLAAHVTFNVDPSDHEDFWRIFWHHGHFRRGKRAELLMAVFLLPVLLGSALLSGSLQGVVVPAFVWWFLTFSVYSYHQGHIRRANAIYDRDPAKWGAISKEAEPVSAACRPGDPEADIRFTLPDE